MSERDLMENVLNIAKALSGLYYHGSIEASTADIHDLFTECLDNTLEHQHSVYMLMSEKGWYKNEQAEAKKIAKACTKFEGK